MNVYDKAYELAKAIKDSSEYAACRQAAQEINADIESKRMMDDFRNRQVEMQQKMMNGETPSPEEMDKMQKLFEVLNLNTKISRMFEAERRLGVIVEDINRIIMEPLKDVL
jgi:cell fate (sporulation/competence/biofilm development) regulator YlbF (YheA/YmcA/DUF963 family)